MKAKTPLRLTVIGVLTALELSGCHLLGPAAMPPPVPDIIRVKEPKPEPPKTNAIPGASEGGAGTVKELYPATGTVLGTPPNLGKKAAAPAEKEGKFTLNFDDADLGEVSKVILGDTLKLNYAINPKVSGKVSLQTARPLAEEELIPTLEMLLQMNGAALIKTGTLYKIEPEANAIASTENMYLGKPGHGEAGYQLRIVPLRYVNVQEMQKAIEPLMPPKSVVRADELRNLLLLGGTAEELDSVMDAIRMFDVDYLRGMSVGLYPLKNVDAATITEELDKIMGASKGPMSGMFKLFPIERMNAIMVVTAQPSYLSEIETWVERLDRYNSNRSGNLHVYRVQNVDAVDLANTIGQIFGQNGGRSGSRGASVAPGLSGSSVSGGSSSSSSGTGGSGGFDDNSSSSGSSSGFGGSSGSSSLGGSSSGSSMGGSSNSGLGGSSSSGLGSSSSSLGGRSSSSGGGGGGGSSFGGSSSSGSSSGGATGRSGARGGATTQDLGFNTKVIADPVNNALIIVAKAQDYKEIEAVIQQLDVMPMQVLIDATIVEVTLGDSLKYGLKWYFDHGRAGAYGFNPPGVTTTTGTTTSTTTGIPSAASPSGALAAAAGGGFTYALVSHAQDIRVELDALAASSKINVLSTPSLMVLNNQEAQINVGDRVPTTTSSNQNLSTAINTVQTSQIQYQESGVTLRVKPRVNAGGLVIMDVNQENSTPSQVTVGGTQTFQFAQRKIHSSVAVPDGETLALGGLIQTKNSTSVSGLPFLSKIPYIGMLFGQTTKSVDRTELVVLLTPRTVTTRPDITKITNDFRRRMTGVLNQEQTKTFMEDHHETKPLK